MPPDNDVKKLSNAVLIIVVAAAIIGSATSAVTSLVSNARMAVVVERTAVTLDNTVARLSSLENRVTTQEAYDEAYRSSTADWRKEVGEKTGIPKSVPRIPTKPLKEYGGFEGREGETNGNTKPR